MTYSFEIPFNCTADISLDGEKSIRHLDAGIYSFTIKSEKQYNLLYSPSTPLSRLLKDERATEILEDFFPEAAETDRNDIEAMSKSLEDEKNRTLLFRMPADNITKAIEKITELR